VSARRLLVVSHPAVLAVNQLPYAALRAHGWEPFVVVPATWRHDYADEPFGPQVLPELSGRVVGRRVALAGQVQRHAYMTSLSRVIARVRPAVAFVEAEPTSVPAFQWGRALDRAGVPFGVQADENLDRDLPLPARVLRRWTLPHAAFVAARSPAAAALAQRWHPGARTRLIPHHVPSWDDVPAAGPRSAFVAGYAGRLVPEKGLDVLVDAAAGLEGVVLRFVGNGPERDALAARAAALGVALEIDTNATHDTMAAAYAGFDVLVLPSRTTPGWSEQFGRVLVEALQCDVPVIGSDSGEIPWVIGVTGGGVTVPEGDADALRAALARLRDDPELRGTLAQRGREQVRARFTVEAVAREYDDALRSALSLPQRGVVAVPKRAMASR
jgi:glycosyltransferase involved in cell wall biosynthesis